MNMNPAAVARNRTARLVREASTPVYSTETKPRVREHLSVVEIEYAGGGRAWSAPMPDSEVDGYLDRNLRDNSVSDIDHAARCWCFNG
jgi:hypothetical protein